MGKAGIAIALMALMLFPGCRRAAPRDPGPRRKITVAHTLQPQSTLVVVALAKGYFTEEGLAAQSLVHTHGRAALQALLDHRADFATVAETPIMFNVLKGERFFVIANIEASTKNNAIVARLDAGIHKPADLRGKRIGFTAGTTSEFFLDSFLTSIGLTRKEVLAVPMKPDEMGEAITGGRVDAVCTWNYPMAQIKRSLGANGSIFFDREIYTETFNIAVSQDLARTDPETPRRFLRALIRAEQFVAAHPDEAQALVAQATGIEPSLVREVWDSFNYVVRLDQTLVITLEDETRWAMKHHLTDQTVMPDYGQIIHPDSLRAVKAEAVRVAR